MNSFGVRTAHNLGKILLLSFIFFHWDNLSCAFKPIVSEQRGQETQRQGGEAFVTLLDGKALSIIPGLVGAGVGTPAGSGPDRVGGSIIHVTTLADSGVGSLREAVETSGPRIIVFDVSGYIQLKSTLNVREPYLTIAGQTAPFPGVSIRDSGITLRTHDVLIQHIRIRVGDGPGGTAPKTRDAITINGSERVAYNIVIDHVSASWAVDENISTYEQVHDVTFANSIVSEALLNSIHPQGPHSMGVLVGEKTQNFLITGNLLAHNNQRNLRANGGTGTLFVNNLVYNWRGARGPASGATEFGGKEGRLVASVVGNVYIRGLDSSSTENAHPIVLRSDVQAGSKVFIEDTEADTSSILLVKTTADVEVNSSPNWIPNLQARKSNVVKNWILSNVGARRADGDPIDLRILNDVRNGTGRIIDSQDDVGGWPPLANNVRGVGGIPAFSIPANEIQPSGYTKVEEWLHFLAKQVEVPR